MSAVLNARHPARPTARPAPKAPKPARTGLWVAGALGGGVVLGGGAMGAVSVALGALGLGGIGLAAVGAWLLSPSEELAVELDPVVAEAPLVEVPVDVAPDDGQPAPAPRASASRQSGPASRTEPPAESATASATLPPPESAPAVAPADPSGSAELPLAEAPAVPRAASGAGPTIPLSVSTTTPGVRVFVDGEDVGTAPVALSLESGSYTVVLDNGKARGTFQLDADLDSGTGWCFDTRGKRVVETTCR